MPIAEVARRKEKFYFDNLPQLKVVPEVPEHIDAQHGRLPLAVVSGSTRDSVTASLRTLQLLEKFEGLVCAGDYKRGKPDPEAFLIAAGRLGVKPKTCMVFEDTDMGIIIAPRPPQEWRR
jgi:HAD superfamily hydrolase (TIGR01509 family)